MCPTGKQLDTLLQYFCIWGICVHPPLFDQLACIEYTLARDHNSSKPLSSHFHNTRYTSCLIVKASIAYDNDN